MNDDVASVVKQIETIAVDAERVFGSLSPTQLNWKPGPERWSVGQCFDHLITANQSYFPAIDNVIEGRRQSSVWQKLPLLPGLWGKLLIKALDPSSTRRVKAPKRFLPAQSDVNDSIIHDFVDQQAVIVEKINATAKLDLERIVITS